jgi:hypothetical protein
MILMDKTKETVTFEFEGTVYQMTREEIEAAYRYREREYRQSDAEVAIEYFTFGSEGPESMTDAEYKQAVDSFEEQYGVKYNDLMKRAPEIVDLFFQKQDCNIAENQTWEDTIVDVVQRMKMQ